MRTAVDGLQAVGALRHPQQQDEGSEHRRADRNHRSATPFEDRVGDGTSGKRAAEAARLE